MECVHLWERSVRDTGQMKAKGTLAAYPPFGASLPLPEKEWRQLLKNASLSSLHIPPLLQNTASPTRFLYMLLFHFKKNCKFIIFINICLYFVPSYVLVFWCDFFQFHMSWMCVQMCRFLLRIVIFALWAKKPQKNKVFQAKYPRHNICFHKVLDMLFAIS